MVFSIEPFIKLQLIVLRPCVFWWQAGGALLNVKLIFGFCFIQDRVYCVLTESELHIRKLVKVGGVIYRSDSDGDGGRTLPDVVPVHVGEPVQLLEIIQTLDPCLHAVTQLLYRSFCILRQGHFGGKLQGPPPVHDLVVCFLRGF